MIIPCNISRAELYLRKNSLRVHFTRRCHSRTINSYYNVRREMFKSLFGRFAHYFGEYDFQVLSTGTWVYTWRIDNED